MAIVCNCALYLLLGIALFSASLAQRNKGQIIFPTKFTENSGVRYQGPGPSNSHPVYDFAKNLYNLASNSKNIDENIVISPFSIRTLLALVYIGARGKTARELNDILSFPEDIEDVIDKFSRQLSTIQSTRNTEYKICNGIFVKENGLLYENYTRQLSNRLKSDIIVNDFSNARQSSNRINNWISDLTERRISNLVSPESISPSTSLMLVNALLFSGKWEKPFEHAKQNSAFNLPSGKQVQVNMIQVESNFDYGYVNQLKSTGISIPFKEERFKLIILKPQEGLPFSQLENLLRNYNLHNLAQEIGENRNVVLTMPKFKLNMNYNLANLIKKMGITSIFDGRTSDLSGMFVPNRRGGRENHAVNQMIHQAVIDVNEMGATAAAGSAAGVYPISSPSFFTVDRPFLFILNDELTGPIFIGRVVNPESFNTFANLSANNGRINSSGKRTSQRTRTRT